MVGPRHYRASAKRPDGVGDAGEYNVLVQGADGTTLSDTATLTYIADGTLIIFK